VILGIVSAAYGAAAAPVWIAVVLVLVGLVVGFINITDKEVGGFLLAALVFLLTYTTIAPLLGALAILGLYISEILKAIVLVIGPAAFVVAFKSVFFAARGR